MKASKARRASLRPFLTLAGMRMTGDGLLKYVKEAHDAFTPHVAGLGAEISDLYHKVISGAEGIGSQYKGKVIPSQFSAELRSIFCHYFKDANEFHVRGLSGAGNARLKRDYENIVERLEDIQSRIRSGGKD